MTFSQIVESLVAKKGMTKNKFLTELGLNHNSFKNWEKQNPSGAVVAKVADYFDVSTDYLLGRTDISLAIDKNSKGGEDAKTSQEINREKVNEESEYYNKLFFNLAKAFDLDGIEIETIRKYVFLQKKHRNKIKIHLKNMVDVEFNEFSGQNAELAKEEATFEFIKGGLINIENAESRSLTSADFASHVQDETAKRATTDTNKA